MTVVFWTPQARDDLQGIYDYVSKDSIKYADLAVDRLFSAAGQLERFPESGRVVPETRRADIREILWRSYRIVYRLNGARDQAHILTVFRSERLFSPLRSGLGGPA